MKKQLLIKSISLLIVLGMMLSLPVLLCACDDNTDAPQVRTFDKTTRFSLKTTDTYVMGMGGSLIDLFTIPDTGLFILDLENTYLQFTPDGKVEGRLQLAKDAFKRLTAVIEQLNLDPALVQNAVTSFDVGGSIDFWVDAIFPGWADTFYSGNFEGALDIIRGSIGFDLDGLDFKHPVVTDTIDYIIDQVKNHNNPYAFPADLLDRFASIDNLSLALTFDNTYCLRTVTAEDGTTYDTICIGDVARNNPSTTAFCTFTFNYEDEEYVDSVLQTVTSIKTRFEFLNIDLAFYKL